MNRKNHIGVGLCGLIFLTSLFMSDGAGLMLNLVAILVVLSGTCGATFLSYPFDDIRAAIRVARNTYATNPPTPDSIVNTLLDVSVRSRHDGILSLEKTEDEISDSFLRDALAMLVDGFRVEEICDVLTTEMYFFKQRRQNLERIFRHMAGLAPAFGITGSVIGLIGMLASVGDMNVIVRTIPIALTSTLYGIILTNFFLTPIAESIHSKTQRELLMQKMALDGVAAIAQEQNSHKLQKKLESFLMPASRPGNQKSFQEIKEKYRLIKEQEPSGKESRSRSISLDQEVRAAA
jgi:chemotaxis protein MotA